jgi:hypothetical protein
MEAKVNCRVHNSLPLDHILSPMNPIYALTYCFFKINVNITLLSMSLSPKWLCPSGLLTKVLYDKLLLKSLKLYK